MSVASPLWSRQQREWLQALGHQPLVLVDRQSAVGAEPSPPPQPAAQPANPATAPVADVRSPVPTQESEDGLQRALLRATGLPAAEAGRTLLSLGVDAAALRGDPAAKRMLWSRLRRLRGGRSP